MRKPYMDSVGKIIGYYEYVKEHLDKLDATYTPRPDTIVEPFEPVMSKILNELKQGPSRNSRFFVQGKAAAILKPKAQHLDF